LSRVATEAAFIHRQAKMLTTDEARRIAINIARGIADTERH
jgi:hypothetical protein